MQAERDSLAGLSEVLTSQTPSLIPNVGGWYNEPDQTSDLQPQQPELIHLRRRLGLPVQHSSQQPAAHQQSAEDGTAQQREESVHGSRQDAQQQFADCTYEV